jgi:hypothetical protein
LTIQRSRGRDDAEADQEDAVMKNTPPFVVLLIALTLGGWFVGLPAALVYGREEMSWLGAIATVWGITFGVLLFVTAGIWHTNRWGERRDRK